MSTRMTSLKLTRLRTFFSMGDFKCLCFKLSLWQPLPHSYQRDCKLLLLTATDPQDLSLQPSRLAATCPSRLTLRELRWLLRGPFIPRENAMVFFNERNAMHYAVQSLVARAPTQYQISRALIVYKAHHTLRGKRLAPQLKADINCKCLHLTNRLLLILTHEGVAQVVVYHRTKPANDWPIGPNKNRHLCLQPWFHFQSMKRLWTWRTLHWSACQPFVVQLRRFFQPLAPKLPSLNLATSCWAEAGRHATPRRWWASEWLCQRVALRRTQACLSRKQLHSRSMFLWTESRPSAGINQPFFSRCCLPEELHRLGGKDQAEHQEPIRPRSCCQPCHQTCHTSIQVN